MVGRPRLGNKRQSHHILEVDPASRAYVTLILVSVSTLLPGFHDKKEKNHWVGRNEPTPTQSLLLDYLFLLASAVADRTSFLCFISALWAAGTTGNIVIVSSTTLSDPQLARGSPCCLPTRAETLEEICLEENLPIWQLHSLLTSVTQQASCITLLHLRRPNLPLSGIAAGL